ncbi:M81 family metallopeptidase [Ammoniphilus sp. YIM 78166]|uniref:M81 family metallopeptidase n=1 Tax=Ammoniphilus sp. YIM 78166 TaxID=1644106 RepID=UPI00106FA27E|nr:M81 family metallopeptidase [Ammoniphilus sp. YIM 78166]
MRVLIGSMLHETNTFNPILTTLEHFDLWYGDQLFKTSLGQRMEGDPSNWQRFATGGIVDRLRAEGVDIVPTVYARANTSGTIEGSAYQTIKEGFLSAVSMAGKLDGICLALHGSMYAQGEEDPEGDLMSSIREIVGPEMPIVCTLDMHATVTNRLIESVNAFTVYRTAPHMDTYQTGERAVNLLLSIIRNQLQVKTLSVKIPMIISGEQTETAVSPMKELMDLVYETDHNPLIMNADYVLGFPWADTPHHSVRTLVSGEVRHLEELQSVAAYLATAFWEKRYELGYSTEAYPLDEALDIAMAELKGPIIISDAGDNPTAGATSDVTLVLNRLLQRKMENVLIAVIVDKEAFDLCKAAGVGAQVRLALGRLEPSPEADPLRVEAEVLHVKSGLEAKTSSWWNSDAAVLRSEGVTFIVAEQRMAVYNPAYLEEVGLNPHDFNIIVIKSGYQSPYYRKIAARSLFALTPGNTNLDIASIPYQVAPRPIFPLDKNFTWNI